MKKLIALIVLLPLLFTGCKVGNVTRSGGMESESYLQFVQSGDNSYPEGIEVYVDNNPVFTAKVDKIGKHTVKGTVYAIKNGARHLKVIYKGNVIYEKNIMVATQETKQIKLP